MRKTGMPGRGELVVCKITSLHPNSVDVKMIEYDKRGMVHVSEVAKRWVRDIREFLKEGQYVVCKVMKVDDSNVHLSIKRVHKTESDRKMSEFKRERKAEKLLELAGKRLKKTLDQTYEEIGHKLQDEFGSLSKAFEISIKNPNLFKQRKIPEKWIKCLSEIAEKSFGEKIYKITAELNIISYQPNGIDIIKRILMTAKNKNKNIKIKYISAPKYILVLSGKNYKTCESKLRSIGEQIVKEAKHSKSEASFKIIE